jgi:ATP-dependent DNA helicase RecQ
MARQREAGWTVNVKRVGAVLHDGIEEFAREVGDRETDRKDVLEWIAEWGREVRRRQSGLLLLAAHRAKGFEFDDVVVLDAGWDRTSAEEDADSVRRLHCVAMTRARRSLSVLALGARHPMLHDMDDPSLLVRTPANFVSDVSAYSKVYQALTLSDVDLDYVGRLSSGHPTLVALEGMAAGDPIRLTRKSDQWFVETLQGIILGRLAKSYSPPCGAESTEGVVTAVLSRTCKESADDWRPHLRQDDWLITLPELVFRRQGESNRVAATVEPGHGACDVEVKGHQTCRSCDGRGATIQTGWRRQRQQSQCSIRQTARYRFLP